MSKLALEFENEALKGVIKILSPLVYSVIVANPFSKDEEVASGTTGVTSELEDTKEELIKANELIKTLREQNREVWLLVDEKNDHIYEQAQRIAQLNTKLGEIKEYLDKTTEDEIALFEEIGDLLEE